MIGKRDARGFSWRQLHAVGVAAVAALVAATGFAAAASATNENYNCTTGTKKTTCMETQGNLNYITNNYGIDYTKNGVCIGTAKWNGSYYEWWALECTSGYEKLVCNGGEYEIYGSGIVYDEASTYDNLAGTQNNYHSCKH